MRPIWVDIHLDRLRDNLQSIQKAYPEQSIFSVVKANGYGHGITQCAKALAMSDGFAVSSFEEAMCLREVGITNPIILLEGAFSEEEQRCIKQQGFECVIHRMEQLEWIEALGGHSGRIWLKLNTGMNRLGLLPSEFTEVYKRAQALSSNVAVMTHFATADEPESPFFLEQQACFKQTLENMNITTSTANSAALKHPEFDVSLSDWLRPGISLYTDTPVMQFCAEVIAIQTLGEGDTVGYGQSWTASDKTRIAVVSAGYGDGYPRLAGGRCEVSIQGRRYPVVGRVSMDMLTVEIDDQIQVGDTVELWGEHISVEEVAAQVETISYELLCGITERVQRRYKKI